MTQAEIKVCQNCKASFEIDAEDFEFYNKMHVPAPAICPDCRFKRRALFRNEMTLYSRKCDLCGRAIISMYNPKSPYTVYCVECYESDKWDAKAYAQEYNPNVPFFDQFKKLMERVPKKAVYISTSGIGPNINSEYTNVAGGNKDCYLVFNGGKNENVMYARGMYNSRDSADIYFGTDLERSYETINVNHSSGIVFGQNISGSLDSWFVMSCSGIQNCFGCVNLRNKSHHFFNEFLGKDEYEKRLAEIKGSHGKLLEFRKKFEEFSLKFPRRENNNLKSVGCVGEYLFESKNLINCFEVTNGEDSKYLFSNKFTKDSYDLTGFGYWSELLLDCVACGDCQRVIGSYAVDGKSHDVEYSFAVTGGEYCFGCDGLKHAKYSILNKQYGEEEYKKLREKIIAELKQKNLYGIFMPPQVAPFGYNETIGQDNMPLTREEALKEGFKWEDDIPRTKGKETLPSENIPDYIKDVPDSTTNEILKCTGCGYNYKIIPVELKFYRQMVLPIPRKCFWCRHQDRLGRRGPFKLYSRSCGKCTKNIQTTYSPDRPEIVYCEECYQREVV